MNVRAYTTQSTTNPIRICACTKKKYSTFAPPNAERKMDVSMKKWKRKKKKRRVKEDRATILLSSLHEKTRKKLFNCKSHTLVEPGPICANGIFLQRDASNPLSFLPSFCPVFPRFFCREKIEFERRAAPTEPPSSSPLPPSAFLNGAARSVFRG